MARSSCHKSQNPQKSSPIVKQLRIIQIVKAAAIENFPL